MRKLPGSPVLTDERSTHTCFLEATVMAVKTNGAINTPIHSAFLGQDSEIKGHFIYSRES